MRFKTVPRPPDDLAALQTVRDALPRVPRSESDCCGRLADRVEWIDDPATAREWLLFLRALDLASRTGDGSYVRSDAEPDAGELAARFGERVLVAEAVRDALGDEPVDAATVFERVRDRIPEWERRRADDWERGWTERVAWLLEWWALFGGVGRRDEGYVRERSRESGHA